MNRNTRLPKTLSSITLKVSRCASPPVSGWKVHYRKELGVFQQSRCVNSIQTPFKGVSTSWLKSIHLNVSVNPALNRQSIKAASLLSSRSESTSRGDFNQSQEFFTWKLPKDLNFCCCCCCFFFEKKQMSSFSPLHFVLATDSSGNSVLEGSCYARAL